MGIHPFTTAPAKSHVNLLRPVLSRGLDGKPPARENSRALELVLAGLESVHRVSRSALLLHHRYTRPTTA
jgi:hypothetical protein